jgi:hypothetical protein
MILKNIIKKEKMNYTVTTTFGNNVKITYIITK